MTKQRRPRASLLARLSKQADDSNVSLDGMISDMRELCSRLGFEEVALRVDDGLSGGYRDRPGFKAWLNDARTGRCDVLVTYHTDRMTREGLNVAAQILDVVEGKDPKTGRVTHPPVRLVDCNGLDSEHGDAFRFRFVIQAEVGRAERERISARQRARDRRLRHRGRWTGGPVPYGYRPAPNPDGAGYVLEIVPEESKVIHDAADWVLAGDPLNRIVRRLNHAGIKPRKANGWSRATLRGILTSEAVMGRLTYRGKPVRDSEGNIMQPWPAILTPDKVSALRAALAPKTAPIATGRKPARLLSGLLCCHSCGRRLAVTTERGRPGYRCPSWSGGGLCERPVKVSAVPIEEYVTDRYLSAVGHMPFYIERTEVTGLAELAAVEEDIRAALEDMARSADADTFQRLSALQKRRDELAAQELDSRTVMVPTGRTEAEWWADAMTDDRRDRLANALDVPLVVRPGRRGRRGFDPTRLDWRWADDGGEEDYSEEEW